MCIKSVFFSSFFFNKMVEIGKRLNNKNKKGVMEPTGKLQFGQGYNTGMKLINYEGILYQIILWPLLQLSFTCFWCFIWGKHIFVVLLSLGALLITRPSDST